MRELDELAVGHFDGVPHLHIRIRARERRHLQLWTRVDIVAGDSARMAHVALGRRCGGVEG